MRRAGPLATLLTLATVSSAAAQTDGVSTLNGLFDRLRGCWRPPAIGEGQPGMQITVLFTFRRDGTILGKPKVTFETPGATDADRIVYRTAVMETLERCTPMPLTGGLGEAIAGRPFRVRFDDRRNSPRQPERKA